AVGRYVATQRALPWTNLWSFTAPDHPFLASSWLYDLVVYGAHRLGGIVGVHVVTVLAVAAAFAVLFLACRTRGASAGWAAATAIALALGSEARFTPRPQVLSYLLLALVSWLLLRSRDRPRWRELWLVPVLLAVWANLHAGVVFGVVLVGCHVLGHWARLLPGPGSTVPRRAVAAGVGALLLCLAAVLLNPGGPDLIRYALFHVSEVGSVVRLGEFETPGLIQRPLFWVVLVALPLLLAWNRREVGVAEWCAWLLFGLLAVRAIRLIPEFFLVIGPSLAWACQRSLARWSPGTRVARALQRASPLLLPAIALAVAPYPLLHLVRRIHLGLDPYRNPVREVEQAGRWGLDGRVFAGWDVTALVEWTLPAARVQMDPRILAYPPSVFHELEAAEDSREAFEDYLRRWNVDWAVRSHHRLRFTGAGLFAPERWAVVQWDEGGQLLLRRDSPRFAELVQREELREFLPATPVVESWRMLRGERRERWLAEANRLAALSPRAVDAHAALCLERARRHDVETASAECARAGAAADERYWIHPTPDGLRSTSAAVAHVVLAAEISRRGAGPSPDALLTRATELAPRSPDVWTGVGAILLERGAGTRAAAAFRRALSVDPENGLARDGLARAQRLEVGR
ncbi:MAG TPA: hypothetical protein VGF41_01705, partial [Myxococcaceae bacterium]